VQGWVVAEGWLKSRAAAGQEVDDIIEEHGCAKVIPEIPAGTSFTAAQNFNLRAGRYYRLIPGQKGV
jgi:hypothetical protein